MEKCGKLSIKYFYETAEVKEMEEVELKTTDETEKTFSITDNINKYIIDVHGNVFDIENDDYIGQDKVDIYVIKQRIVGMIRWNKKDWEITKESNYKNKKDSRVIFAAGLTEEQNEEIKRALS